MAMLIDEFVVGKIAMTIKSNGSIKIPEDLMTLEHAIDDAAGKHITNGMSRKLGFADYCMHILSYVKERDNIDSIEVITEEDFSGFGYMPAGTQYFIEYGLEVVDAREVLNEVNGLCAHSKEEFFEILG